MDYFLLKYQLNKAEHFLIWISNEMDRVVIDPSGKPSRFQNSDEARQYAAQQGWTLYEAPILYDLDIVAAWVDQPAAETIHCEVFLNTWNLLGDVANSMAEFNFDDESELADQIYDKLFWGNNLPSITPADEYYIPTWAPDEVMELRQIMANGLKQFAIHLSTQD